MTTFLRSKVHVDLFSGLFLMSINDYPNDKEAFID
jgi:hypothetical protein